MMTEDERQRHLDNLSHSGGLRKPMFTPNSPAMSPSPSARDFDSVRELIVPLLNEQGAKKRLRAATQEHNAALERLQGDRAEFDRHMGRERAALEAMVHAKTTALDERESAHHEAVQSFHAERDAEHKQIEQMRAAAEKDREQAAHMLKVARAKIQAFESA
jgi:hypothetical protein